ncbi:hypothetical protein [Pyrococcus kukulkanii]|uniref:hypothetical protein n=1 Tax=Pyrococcus kukulkanii TaxID=1609559 RepID=UPI003561E467
MSWLIFVDKSDEGDYSYISLLIIRDSNKGKVYNNIVKWVKHSRKLGKRKIKYFNDFPNRYSSMLPLIEVSRAYSYKKGSQIPSVVFMKIDEYYDDFTIIVVDDKLAKAFQRRYGKDRVLIEGKLTDKQLKKIMELVDNLCNYLRLKKNMDLVWK